MDNKLSEIESRLERLRTSLDASGKLKSRLYMRDYKRKYRAEHRGQYNDYQREYEKTHQNKRNFHRVGTRVSGKTVYLQAPYKKAKPVRCEICNRNAKQLDYHHWDDSKPSKGLWLCRRCHTAVEALEHIPDFMRRCFILKSKEDKRVEASERAQDT